MTKRNKKYIKLMCDYCAEGVWDADGASISLDSVPIPFWLKQLIQRWQADFEKSWNSIYSFDGTPGISDSFDWEEFAKVGYALAVKVKQALPDWTVMYHDENKSRDAFSRADRSYYLYEITIPVKTNFIENQK